MTKHAVSKSRTTLSCCSGALIARRRRCVRRALRRRLAPRRIDAAAAGTGAAAAEDQRTAAQQRALLRSALITVTGKKLPRKLKALARPDVEGRGELSTSPPEPRRLTETLLGTARSRLRLVANTLYIHDPSRRQARRRAPVDQGKRSAARVGLFGSHPSTLGAGGSGSDRGRAAPPDDRTVSRDGSDRVLEAPRNDVPLARARCTVDGQAGDRLRTGTPTRRKSRRARWPTRAGGQSEAAKSHIKADGDASRCSSPPTGLPVRSHIVLVARRQSSSADRRSDVLAIELPRRRASGARRPAENDRRGRLDSWRSS